MKKYKTVIEVVCEAEDKGEALDVAGEYLRGSIDSGVMMRCKTAPLCNTSRMTLNGLCLLFLVVIGIMSTSFYKTHQSLSVGLAGFDACQAPLKTKIEGKAKIDFKEGWRDQELNKALEGLAK